MLLRGAIVRAHHLLRLIALAGLLALAACGARQTADGPGPGTGPVADTGPMALPPPAELAVRHSSGGGADFRRDASSVDPALPLQQAQAAAPLLNFTPDYTSQASNPSGISLALYRFNSTGYAGDPSLRLGWASTPENGTAWVGLGNLSLNHWQWRTLPVTNSLTFPGGLAPYSAANGDVLVVVAVSGTGNDCSLSYIRFGNEPPHPVLVVTNAAGPLPLQASFDATGSTDFDGTIAGYEIDFGEGSGFQPMPGGTIDHTYSNMGTFQAKVRATDNEGGQGEQQAQIDAGVPSNQPPVASLAATPNKGAPGTTVQFDAGTSSDPDGTIVNWQWDPEGDGTYLINGIPGGSSTRSWLYSQPGTYQATVRVTDDKGASSTASKTVTIGYGTLLKGKVLDSAGCDYPSIGTANGKPCVAYVQGSQLAFVRATTGAADTWFSPQLLAQAGIGCSLATVAGQPAIAYHDGADSVKFIRANNADGTTWASPFTIAASNDLFGFYPALTVINGMPAATFCDAAGGFSGNTWYARATNSTGTVWGSKHKVSANGQTGFCTNLLALSNGTPCAGVLRTAGLDIDQMQFALANDTSGTVWNPPIPVGDGKRIIGLSYGLAVVAGRPAMAYYDKDAGKVMFMRAKDASGLSWNTPVEVGAAGQAGGNLSLAVINSLPVIAYTDTASGLLLSTATGTLGTGWNGPLTIDSETTSPLAAVSLMSYNDCPALAYGQDDILRFAYWH
jgi:PKD repeat protein